ncbi:hypothetical protein NQ317_001602 [Molorchus minor]|uniref:Uncharacterized protein n=1 Tax=Molorchus minor TaxID=1323400 RepID=A0ABQ9J618_9CUCU|nr:hypothetical protein NQ317_001602 [Molorchus minor]
MSLMTNDEITESKTKSEPAQMQSRICAVSDSVHFILLYASKCTHDLLAGGSMYIAFSPFYVYAPSPRQRLESVEVSQQVEHSTQTPVCLISHSHDSKVSREPGISELSYPTHFTVLALLSQLAHELHISRLDLNCSVIRESDP